MDTIFVDVSIDKSIEMANHPIAMSKLRQVLKLYSRGIGKKAIARQLGTSKNTVKLYIDRISQTRLTIQELLKKSDSDLNELFNPPRKEYTSDRLKQLYSFFPEAERLLRARGMTRGKVHQEYLNKHPDGFMKSQFNMYFIQWKKRSSISMHIEHKSGDKMYVDFTGEKLEYLDPQTGEIKKAEVFVAILGWSQYPYVEAVYNQSNEEFIRACENAIHAFEGVPRAIVPDNLKSAVIKPNRYEPELNDNFRCFSEEYGTTILPARVRKPQDKAHVENMVKIVYKEVFTELDKQQITTIEELNLRIGVLVEKLSNAKLTGLNTTRFERWQMERLSLDALPQHRFEYRTMRTVTVMKSSHVLLGEDRHYYSVPHQYIGKKVKLVYSHSKVDVYYKYDLITTHKRMRSPGNYSTQAEHLPSQHKVQSEWTPNYFIDAAAKIDADVASYIGKILVKKTHPEQAYKSCMGVLRLERRYGRERLIAACRRGLHIGYHSYKTVEEILKRGIDRYELEKDTTLMPSHTNIRGREYYK